jgi:hypothetical protein
MDNLDRFTSKHSENAAQAILEAWEKWHGIKHAAHATLEDRWAFFIRETDKFLLAA